MVLYGSPHLVGSTFRLLQQFKQALENNGLESYQFRQFDLFEMNLKPCNHCGYCQYGLCHMNHLDGYSSIIESIQSSDLIILATPVYFGGYPAPVKAFLDRLQQFYVNDFKARKYTFPKRTQGLLFFTSGNPNSTTREAMEHSARMLFHCINAEFTGTLFYENTDADPNFEVDCEQLLHSLERDLE